MVDNYDHVFSTVWSAFTAFSAEFPDGHPLITVLIAGKVQMPKDPQPSKQNCACWENKVKGLANKIKDTVGPQILVGSCWMAKYERFSVAKEMQSKNVTFFDCR